MTARPGPGDPAPQPAATDFFVVMNAGSGQRAATRRRDAVEAVLRQGGARADILLVRRQRTLGTIIAQAVAAAQAVDGVVVAAGGDGTINAVVQQVLPSGLRFAALPQGTFNFFGRNQGLSEDLEQAARDLLDAEERAVQVGEVNGRVFLVNASLGLYRRLLQDREAFKRRLGRSRLVALWAGLNTLLRPHPRLELCVRHGGSERREPVLTLVVGNNRLQLAQMGLDDAEAVEHGELLGLRLAPLSRPALLAVALRGLLGQWVDGDHGEAFVFDEMTVNPLPSTRRSLRLGLDGEIVRLRPPLNFRVAAQRLRLLVPRPRETPP